MWMTGRVTSVPRGGPDLPLAPAASSQPMTPTERWPSTAHGLRSLPLRVHAWGQGVSREVSPGPGTPLTRDLEQGGASGWIPSSSCIFFLGSLDISHRNRLPSATPASCIRWPCSWPRASCRQRSSVLSLLRATGASRFLRQPGRHLPRGVILRAGPGGTRGQTRSAAEPRPKRAGQLVNRRQINDASGTSPSSPRRRPEERQNPYDEAQTGPRNEIETTCTVRCRSLWTWRVLRRRQRSPDGRTMRRGRVPSSRHTRSGREARQV